MPTNSDLAAPFDWAELADAVLTARKQNVPEYLRYRIEAAFVPVERYEAERIEWLQRDLVAQNKAAKYCLVSHQATDRAEAAEARVKVLEELLDDMLPPDDVNFGGCKDSQAFSIIVAVGNIRAARQALGADHGK